MIPDADRKRAQRRLLGWALLLVALAALAGAWHFTPLGDLVDFRALLARTDELHGHPLAPLIVVAAFVVVGVLMLPVTPVVVVAVGAFPPLVGFGYALLGVTVLAALAFGVGRIAGRRQLERLAGSPVHRVSQRLGDAGILAITMARMVPVAHFTIISLTAGASHIRWRDFLVGTVLGMTPGVAVIAFVLDQAASALRDPGAAQIAAVVLASTGLLLALIALRLWTRRG